MKKAVLLFVAATTTSILVSCGLGNETEQQAAKDFCDCHGPAAKLMKEAGNSGSVDDLLSAGPELTKALSDQKVCHEAWMATYNGRVDVDVLKEEVKAIDKDVYKMANEQGFFGK